MARGGKRRKRPWNDGSPPAFPGRKQGGSVSSNGPGAGSGVESAKGAKKLLADAGYANGFGLTLHGSKDRVQGDADITQSIGQIFARGGIKMNAVEVCPYSVYAPVATQRKYSIFLFSYGNSKGDSSAGRIGPSPFPPLNRRRTGCARRGPRWPSPASPPPRASPAARPGRSR